MHYQFLFRWLAVAQLLAVLARADYIMDDRNATIRYNGFWNRETGDLNSTLLFDGTVSVVEENLITSLLK